MTHATLKTLLSHQQEMESIDRRHRRAIATSIGVHALIFLWIALYHTFAPEPEALTEITWLDASELEALVMPPAAVAAELPPEPVEEVVVPPPPKEQAHFQREDPEAEVAPDPQTPAAVDNNLKERLATLQQRVPSAVTRLGAVDPTAPPTLSRSAVPGPATRSAPVALNREGTATAAPVELRRAATRSAARAVAVQTPHAEATAMPAQIDSTIQRTIAGAKLVGTVADRPIQSYIKPLYPPWAKKQAVEASVTLQFVVLPDGRVKDSILVQKTSGYQDFDRNAIRALQAWRFAPLTGGATGEQWGAITFNFRLHDSKGN